MTSSQDIPAASFEPFPYVTKPWFTKGAEQNEKDLEILQEKALELDATRATIITTDKIVVDDRAGQFKCRIPPCKHYNRNLMCPPHSPKPWETRQIVNNFKRAILVRKECDPVGTVNPGYITKMDPEEAHKVSHKFRMLEHELTILINRLEGEAFHMGYHMAMGFGAGTCFWCSLKHSKDGYIPLRVICEGIKSGECSFPDMTRPSMEASGMDVYTTVTNAGWPIYVVGQRSDPTKVECVGAHGLLLVY